MSEIHTEQTVQTAMLALLKLNKKKINSNATINRVIRNSFGCTADVVAVVWNKLIVNFEMHKFAKIKNLLWMCSYFKSYLEYEHYATIYNCTEKTFRYWVWYLAELVSKLEIVSRHCGTRKIIFFTNKFY
jgi:hypothetical protein